MEAGKQEYLRSQLLDRREKLLTAVPLSLDNAPLNRLLREVDLALERMSQGTYGLCEICHDPIEEARLLGNPLARNCLDHLSPDEQRALEQDLDLAWRIQSGLLPKQDFRFGHWEVYYHYEAVGPVSGDYCDLMTADGSDMFFLLGDVSGKGVSASILMSHLHAVFRSLVSVGLPFDQLMERANRLFCDSTSTSSFATLVCGKAGTTGTIEICIAGHCPPLLIGLKGTSDLEATGLPLGMFFSSPYGVRNVTLEPGECLLLYTDGLTEARNKAGEEYGASRLAGVVKDGFRLPPRSLVEACLGDLNRFLGGASKGDDIAIMAIRRVQLA